MIETLGDARAEIIEPRSEDFRRHSFVGDNSLQHEAAIRGDIREELAAAQAIVVAEQTKQRGARNIGGGLRQLIEPGHQPNGGTVLAEHRSHRQVPLFFVVDRFELEVPLGCNTYPLALAVLTNAPFI